MQAAISAEESATRVSLADTGRVPQQAARVVSAAGASITRATVKRGVAHVEQEDTQATAQEAVPIAHLGATVTKMGMATVHATAPADQGLTRVLGPHPAHGAHLADILLALSTLAASQLVCAQLASTAAAIPPPPSVAAIHASPAHSSHPREAGALAVDAGTPAPAESIKPEPVVLLRTASVRGTLGCVTAISGNPELPLLPPIVSVPGQAAAPTVG
jgi:hypothetical protein